MTAKTQARAKGEAAGQRCLDRAERAEPEWSDSVLHMLRWFGKIRKVPWTTEDFRAWAHSRGLPYPTDNRAIGPLIRKAINDGLIQPAGFAPTISSHGAVRRTYVRCV